MLTLSILLNGTATFQISNVTFDGAQLEKVCLLFIYVSYDENLMFGLVVSMWVRFIVK